MAPNNSTTGGYLQPTSTTPIPGGLTLNQFIQTVLVGISNLPGSFVRPQWQPKEPTQPDISVDWMAFGVIQTQPDAYGFVGMDDSGNMNTQRHEDIEVSCSIYGPLCLENAELIRDGFQIQQNLDALRTANMSFVSTGDLVHLPELINERWFDRYEMSVFLRREIQRVYPILSILSANGTIHSVVGNEEYLLEWSTEN